MFTDGGAMSGYCSTDSERMLATPASMIAMAMTQAKTGRSMKMRETMRSAPAPRRAARSGQGRRACGDRPDHVARLQPVQALGDHPVARRQARGDQPLVADRA